MIEEGKPGRPDDLPGLRRVAGCVAWDAVSSRGRPWLLSTRRPAPRPGRRTGASHRGGALIGEHEPRERLTALHLLRQRTTHAHHRLDSGLVGADLTVRDEATYVRLLSVLVHLHARAEVPLHAWVARTAWVRERLAQVSLPERTRLYADDLRGLGAPVDLPPSDSPYDDAAGIAALYLVAGSTKGARALRTRLPDDVGAGCRLGLDDACSASSRRLWPAVHSLLTRPGTGGASPADGLAEDAAGHAMRLFADLHGLTGAPTAPVAPVGVPLSAALGGHR